MKRSFEYLWEIEKTEARFTFEEICNEIFKYHVTNAQVKRVRLDGGDGGVDISVSQNEKESVVQCKFFRNDLGESQKNQIRSSFNSLNKSNVYQWILCIPIVLSSKELKWWTNWKIKQEKNIKLKSTCMMKMI